MSEILFVIQYKVLKHIMLSGTTAATWCSRLFISFRQQYFTFSASGEKASASADAIDQNQTAQNVQSDLDLCCLLVKTDICTIICSRLYIKYLKEVGLTYMATGGSVLTNFATYSV